MTCPLSVDGAAGAVGTRPMAWTVCCTGTGAVAAAGAGAGAGAVEAAETDLEGALSLASFLMSYSDALCASVFRIFIRNKGHLAGEVHPRCNLGWDSVAACIA
jgi:hypothetical protein